MRDYKDMTIEQLKNKIKFGENAGGPIGIKMANKAREELNKRALKE